MKNPVPKTLLIVEDDAGLRQSLVEFGAKCGFEVRDCDTAEEALALAKSFRPTVIFCDVHLAHGDGRRVLVKLREDEAAFDCQFVLMTGDWVGAPQSVSIALEADAYLAKPFPMEEFVACLQARYAQANL
jgi:DNA-binding response OmpR family regulator